MALHQPHAFTCSSAPHHEQLSHHRDRYLLYAFRTDIQSNRNVQPGDFRLCETHLSEIGRQYTRSSRTPQDPNVSDIRPE